MGQLGTGLDNTQALSDALSPVPVPPFALHGMEGENSFVRVQQIACGVSHSLLIDENSAIWSWGARGRACLGHGDTVIATASASKRSSLFTAELAFDKQDAEDGFLPERELVHGRTI